MGSAARDQAYRLARTLADDARAELELGRPEAALVLQFAAYALVPHDSSLLHAAGAVYERLDDPDSAQLCRWGVVPREAERRFFGAGADTAPSVSARRAAACRHLAHARPERRRLDAPRGNLAGAPHPEFRHARTANAGSFVSVLDEGSLWFDGFHTLVRDARGRVLTEHVRGSARVALDIASRRPVVRLPGRVCVLDAQSSPIYYHWMFDVLPKLAVLASVGIDADSIDAFVVRADHPFQRETLARFGIGPERIVAPPASRSLVAERLVVPFLRNDIGERPYRALGLGTASWVPRWLRERFVGAPSTDATRRRLYVARAADGDRALVGEAELEAALARRGFQTVRPETLDIAGQARLFDGADTVLAPHGAALTNIAFCRPGTLVIEVFGEHVVPSYWALAGLAGLDYRQYLAHTGPSERNMDVRRTSDIAPDVDDLLAHLDRWLLSRPAAPCARAAAA